jgi:hypothetical protein
VVEYLAQSLASEAARKLGASEDSKIGEVLLESVRESLFLGLELRQKPLPGVSQLPSLVSGSEEMNPSNQQTMQDSLTMQSTNMLENPNQLQPPLV